MAIEYKKKVAVLTGSVSVEEAEGLLEWLQNNPKGSVNLGDCTHLHAANLQVLMATQPHINLWPRDADLQHWLHSALISN